MRLHLVHSFKRNEAESRAIKKKNALDPANFAHERLWKIIVYHEGSVALICGQSMEEVVYCR